MPHCGDRREWLSCLVREPHEALSGAGCHRYTALNLKRLRQKSRYGIYILRFPNHAIVLIQRASPEADCFAGQGSKAESNSRFLGASSPVDCRIDPVLLTAVIDQSRKVMIQVDCAQV